MVYLQGICPVLGIKDNWSLQDYLPSLKIFGGSKKAVYPEHTDNNVRVRIMAKEEYNGKISKAGKFH